MWDSTRLLRLRNPFGLAGSIVLFIAILLLNGCGGEGVSQDVSGDEYPPPLAIESTIVAAPVVILIGGIDSDPTAEQIAGNATRGQGNCGPYQLRGDLLAKGYQAEYFNWNGTRAGEIDSENAPFADGIAAFIRDVHADKKEAPIVIVGNSWGGHTAWEVCDLLSVEPAIEVELVVFLDPSSLGRSTTLRPQALPECVRAAATYFTRNAGGWGAWNDEPRIENIDLGDPANGFLIEGGPAYDSAFSLTAHIAAEWDERIHAAIQARIAAAVHQ